MGWQGAEIMPLLASAVKGLVCHVSASTWGDGPEIDKWHRQRGFSQIGYHAVVLNGVRTYQAGYDIAVDGQLENGRAEDVMGAHCLSRGMNACSIGVCCIGNPGWPTEGVNLAPKEFIQANRRYLTERQLTTLVDWLVSNCRQYGLDPRGTFQRAGDGKTVHVISQHSDHDPAKPFCASLSLPALRDLVASRM